MYGPPEHADGVVHATKEEADAAEISDQDADARDLDTSDSGSLGIGSLKGR